MRINHNISSMIAQGSNFRIQHDLNKSLEKLSTGVRINRASDDAAGLSVSEQMRTQIKCGQMAERNTGDAVAFLKIAEGALNEISNCVQRMRELAVQGANDTYTRTERAYMQQEYEALRNELERITHNTQYNGITLFEKNTSIALVDRVDGKYHNGTVALDGVSLNPLAGIQNISYEEGATGNDTTGGRVFSFQIGANSGGAAGAYDVFDSANMLNVALPDMSLTALFLQQSLNPATISRQDAQLFDHRVNETAAANMRVTRDGLTDVITIATGAYYMKASVSCENTIAIIDGQGRGNVPGAEGPGEVHVTGLRRVNAVRSYIGSLINRLEHSQNNLSNQIQNTQNAEATIRDVDFAEETSMFTRAQILSQSSAAMLSQANTVPNYILSLLS